MWQQDAYRMIQRRAADAGRQDEISLDEVEKISI
jgi:hypothetical protein